MHKQTLLFVFALALTLLVGCWNKPFDLEVWNSTTDDDERCAMAASLIKLLPGMSRATYDEMFNQHFENSLPSENATLPSFELLYVGECRQGCHGGGIAFIKVEIEDGKIVRAVLRNA